MSPEDGRKRQEIGDRFIVGKGYEIGAGAFPSRYSGLESVVYLDTRSDAELQKLFRAEMPYQVRSIDGGHPAQDVLIAHHVIEHLADPIGAIASWCALLRDTGRMFLSLPAADNLGEKDRMPAPFEHILDDHLFGRGPGHFDSMQHVPHFIDQWAAMDPTSFWYAQGSVAKFASTSLFEARRDNNDIHWHTFTMDVFREVMTAGFWFAGHGIRFLHTEQCYGALYVVAAKDGAAGELPAAMRAHRERLAKAVGALTRSTPEHNR
jgi:SAM-dependent methyltransferase